MHITKCDTEKGNFVGSLVFYFWVPAEEKSSNVLILKVAEGVSIFDFLKFFYFFSLKIGLTLFKSLIDLKLKLFLEVIDFKERECIFFVNEVKK